VTEPTPGAAIVRGLAYVHPLWMVASLALCIVALRAGLALRRARIARRPPPGGARERHLRVAKPAVALVLGGFALGPVTVAALRDWTPMSSFHSLLGGLAVLLFVGASLQGRRLERGDRTARETHARLAAAATALALAAAVAGFVLLP